MLQCPNCGESVGPNWPSCPSCGAFFTNRTKSNEGGRILAILIGVVGACVALYFFLFFSVAAPGSVIVNEGRMNDRLVGALLGGMAALGSIVYLGLNKPTAPPSVLTVNDPPPAKPAFFVWPVGTALVYALPAQSNSASSFPAWKASVLQHQTANKIARALTDRQLAWGHSYNLTPADFFEAIRYIESVREYHTRNRI